MRELLKIQFGWGTMHDSDIVDYVPIVISYDDYKYITGHDYQAPKATNEPDVAKEADEPNEAKEN